MGDEEENKDKGREDEVQNEEESDLERCERKIVEFKKKVDDCEAKYEKSRSSERELLTKDIEFYLERLKSYKKERDELLLTQKISFPTSTPSSMSSISSTPLFSRFFQPSSSSSSPENGTSLEQQGT